MTNKKILISQSVPMNVSPYTALTEKFGAEIDFKPFFLLEPLTSKEFRTQRINIPDYTAIVFSARHVIDAFFKMCDELRYKVPETMKYFCTTEAVAVYLQKHIVYRKRKIFFGDGTAQSVINLIGPKHKGENFLITTSDSNNSAAIKKLFEESGLKFSSAVFVKSVPQDLHSVDISSYDVAVVYTPADVRSLMENYPDFKPGKLKFITYGKKIVEAMEEAGLPVEIKAPNPEANSVSKALEIYLSSCK